MFLQLVYVICYFIDALKLEEAAKRRYLWVSQNCLGWLSLDKIRDFWRAGANGEAVMMAVRLRYGLLNF